MFDEVKPSMWKSQMRNYNRRFREKSNTGRGFSAHLNQNKGDDGQVS